MARRLIETDCMLIRDTLQKNMAIALSEVSAQNDYTVSTEEPAEYFFYRNDNPMRCPAVFIVGQSMDFRQGEKQANYISASSNVIVSVVIEDRTQDLCTVKAWRYQAAAHQVLDQAVLTSADNGARLIVVVKRAEMSPIFSAKNSDTDPEAAFRQEIYLECDVDHYETY